MYPAAVWQASSLEQVVSVQEEAMKGHARILLADDHDLVAQAFVAHTSNFQPNLR